MSVLNLSGGEYHILNWLSILLENRTFRISNHLGARSKDYILTHFLPSYKSYDIIKGYRADDSYFSFATAFLNNSISLSQLENAMHLGKLGEQIVILSSLAFDRLHFVDSTIADKTVYYPRKIARDYHARQAFLEERSSPAPEQDYYMLDIIRERWDCDDIRLQRIVPI